MAPCPARIERVVAATAGRRPHDPAGGAPPARRRAPCPLRPIPDPKALSRPALTKTESHERPESRCCRSNTRSPPAPAPALPPLAEAYPACFDWENPRPLKINIHRDWMTAGHYRIAVQRALGRYGQADRYRKALQTGASRIDLQGQPAGVVTEKEATHARNALTPAPPAPPSPRGPAPRAR